MRRVEKSPSPQASFLLGIDMLVQNIDLVAIEAHNLALSAPHRLKNHDRLKGLFQSLERHLADDYQEAEQLAARLRDIYAEQNIEYMEIPDKRR